MRYLISLVISYVFLQNFTMTTGMNTSYMRMDRMAGYCVALNAVQISSLRNCFFNLAGSIDGNAWVDISGSTLTVSRSVDHMWNVSQPFYNYVRVESTITSGSLMVNISGRAVKI